MSEEKLQMFRNRLTRMYRHVARLARRQGVTCYRVYDHDLPEFPFCIERYEDKLYLAEYQRRHGMTEEEHAAWLESCIPTISEVLETPDEQIFYRERRRKADAPPVPRAPTVEERHAQSQCAQDNDDVRGDEKDTESL